MEKQKFTIGWLKFFFLYDHVSKVLLALSVAGLAFCFVDGFQHPILALSMATLLVITVGVSFFTYLILGRYREACVNKFYDAVRYAGDLPTEYEGRDLKRVKIDWKWRRVRSLKFSVSTNAPAVRSDHEWRTIQRAARESFRFEHKNMLTFLEQHLSGVFVFRSATDEDLANNPEIMLAVSKESMYAFAYESLSSVGASLPMITRFDADDDGLKAVDFSFERQLSEYDMQRFTSGFNRKFSQFDVQWVFDWSSSGVMIHAVKRGSEEEQRMVASQSLGRLVESAVRASFVLHDSHEYVFDADGMGWDSAAATVEQFAVDFLQSDVSRPERVEEFEMLMKQGLRQLFPETFWEFLWDVSAYKKLVLIRKIQKSAVHQGPVKIIEEFVVPIPERPAPVVAPRPVAPAAAKKVIPARPVLQGLPPRPPKLEL